MISGEGITNERTKVFVYIKDRRLRADAIEVAVFRQIKSDNEWEDAEVNPETAKLIENLEAKPLNKYINGL